MFSRVGTPRPPNRGSAAEGGGGRGVSDNAADPEIIIKRVSGSDDYYVTLGVPRSGNGGKSLEP